MPLKLNVGLSRKIGQPRPPSLPDPRRQQQLSRRRASFEQTRLSLDRWMARLRRAFHSVAKLQRNAGSLERQIRKLEQA